MSDGKSVPQLPRTQLTRLFLDLCSYLSSELESSLATDSSRSPSYDIVGRPHPQPVWHRQGASGSLGRPLAPVSQHHRRPTGLAFPRIDSVVAHVRVRTSSISHTSRYNQSIYLTISHSSSSAIFERDIEPIVCPSPPHTSAHPPNPHRMPRSKATEQLEHSVPSVLDSAAEILTASLSPSDDISVISPRLDAGRRSGFTSPIGSLRSRSPSPLGNGPSAAHVKSLLLSIPSPSSPNHPHTLSPHQPQVGNASPPQGPSTRPIIQTTVPASGSVTPPSIITPTTSAYYSTTSSVASSPKTTTLEHFPGTVPPVPIPGAHNTTSSPVSGVLLNPSHPPSPTHSATKRLSFMSYSDLLSSTPTSLVPLSSFTAPTTSEPPPHLPIVSGLAQAALPPRVPFAQGSAGASGASGGGAAWRDSMVLDDVGGEWEREGLGRGLDERLEEALRPGIVGLSEP